MRKARLFALYRLSEQGHNVARAIKGAEELLNEAIEDEADKKTEDKKVA